MPMQISRLTLISSTLATFEWFFYPIFIMYAVAWSLLVICHLYIAYQLQSGRMAVAWLLALMIGIVFMSLSYWLLLSSTLSFISLVGFWYWRPEYFFGFKDQRLSGLSRGRLDFRGLALPAFLRKLVSG